MPDRLCRLRRGAIALRFIIGVPGARGGSVGRTVNLPDRLDRDEDGAVTGAAGRCHPPGDPKGGIGMRIGVDRRTGAGRGGKDPARRHRGLRHAKGQGGEVRLAFDNLRTKRLGFFDLVAPWPWWCSAERKGTPR